MRISPALGFAIAAFLLLLSLPAIPGQIRALAEFLGMSGAEWQWWNYAGVSIALIMMFLSAYPAWRRLVRFVSGGEVTLDWPLVRDVIAPVVVVAVSVVTIIGVVIYLFTMERPSFTWTHPALAVQEQEKAKADCKMQAFDAIGGRGSLSAIDARNNYRSACLTAKGFVLREVDG